MAKGPSAFQGIQRTLTIHGYVVVNARRQFFLTLSSDEELAFSLALSPTKNKNAYIFMWVNWLQRIRHSKDSDNDEADRRTNYWRIFPVGIGHRTSNTLLFYSFIFFSRRTIFSNEFSSSNSMMELVLAELLFVFSSAQKNSNDLHSLG